MARLTCLHISMAQMVISDVFSGSLFGLLVTSDLWSKNENTILQYTLLSLIRSLHQVLDTHHFLFRSLKLLKIIAEGLRNI